MKILIFVSKLTGLAMVDTLRKFSDEYLFIVGEKDTNLITEALDSFGYKYLSLHAFKHEDYLPKSFDWLINLWGSHIFSSKELKLSKFSLNIHPSYLPFSKGSDPVLWSQLMSLPQGVTIHEMSDQLDAGPIYIREFVNTPLLSTGESNYKIVVDRCISIFNEAWPDIRSGKTRPITLDKVNHHQANKREQTVQNQYKEFSNLEESEKKLLNWLLAYNYGPGFLPIITLNGIEFKMILDAKNNLD